MRQFPCPQCGANLAYKPNTTVLICANCNYEQPIEPTSTSAAELDYHHYLMQLGQESEMHEVLTVKCQQCGAQTTLEANITAGSCPFCGTHLVMTQESQRLIKPQTLLPFKVNHTQAQDSFRQWLKGLWFAPNGLLLQAYSDETDIVGVYLPHWTYDCHATTHYSGERGDDYNETEHYTEIEEGKTVHKTRQVVKTRWHAVSGVVYNQFDDVLIVATDSLPTQYIQALEPWDLPELVSYQDDYLSGFRSESYRISLAQGFDLAKKQFQATISETIRHDIGGDKQRISHQSSAYDNMTFKHVLLPVWLNAYRYQNETYRFLVNARTGEVQGERPLSWWKILFAIFLDLAGASIVGYLGYQVTAPDYRVIVLGAAALVAVIGLLVIYTLAAEGHQKTEPTEN